VALCGETFIATSLTGSRLDRVRLTAPATLGPLRPVRPVQTCLEEVLQHVEIRVPGLEGLTDVDQGAARGRIVLFEGVADRVDIGGELREVEAILLTIAVSNRSWASFFSAIRVSSACSAAFSRACIPSRTRCRRSSAAALTGSSKLRLTPSTGDTTTTAPGRRWLKSRCGLALTMAASAASRVTAGVRDRMRDGTSSFRF
jgi:hypothetical protein